MTPTTEHAPPRPGDVRDSLADISAAGDGVRLPPGGQLEEGLAEYMAWGRKEIM